MACLLFGNASCVQWHPFYIILSLLLWINISTQVIPPNRTRLGFYILSDKTSYHHISRSLEAARYGFKVLWSLRNCRGTSALLQPIHELTIIQHTISLPFEILWDLTIWRLLWIKALNHQVCGGHPVPEGFTGAVIAKYCRHKSVSKGQLWRLKIITWCPSPHVWLAWTQAN